MYPNTDKVPLAARYIKI